MTTPQHRRSAWPGLKGALALLMALAVVTPCDAQDSTFTLGVGADYSTGDYGTGQDVDIWSVPVRANVETGRWKLELTVPYIAIRSAGDVVGGTDGPIVTKKKKNPAANTRTTESGLGDIVGSVGYAVLSGNDGLPLVEVTGKIKFPTASESKGLGTGQFDYTAQIDVAKEFGRITPFATIGYRFIGEDSSLDLNNVLFVSVGAGYMFNDRISAGLAVDYSQATTGGVDDPLELSPYLSWSLGDRWSLDVYGLIGLSGGSPDSGGGAHLSVAF